MDCLIQSLNCHVTAINSKRCNAAALEISKGAGKPTVGEYFGQRGGQWGILGEEGGRTRIHVGEGKEWIWQDLIPYSYSLF